MALPLQSSSARHRWQRECESNDLANLTSLVPLCATYFFLCLFLISSSWRSAYLICPTPSSKCPLAVLPRVRKPSIPWVSVSQKDAVWPVSMPCTCLSFGTSCGPHCLGLAQCIHAYQSDVVQVKLFVQVVLHSATTSVSAFPFLIFCLSARSKTQPFALPTSLAVCWLPCWRVWYLHMGGSRVEDCKTLSSKFMQ